MVFGIASETGVILLLSSFILTVASALMIEVVCFIEGSYTPSHIDPVTQAVRPTKPFLSSEAVSEMIALGSHFGRR